MVGAYAFMIDVLNVFFPPVTLHWFLLLGCFLLLLLPTMKTYGELLLSDIPRDINSIPVQWKSGPLGDTAVFNHWITSQPQHLAFRILLWRNGKQNSLKDNFLATFNIFFYRAYLNFQKYIHFTCVAVRQEIECTLKIKNLPNHTEVYWSCREI